MFKSSQRYTIPFTLYHLIYHLPSLRSILLALLSFTSFFYLYSTLCYLPSFFIHCSAYLSLLHIILFAICPLEVASGLQSFSTHCCLPVCKILPGPYGNFQCHILPHENSMVMRGDVLRFWLWYKLPVEDEIPNQSTQIDPTSPHQVFWFVASSDPWTHTTTDMALLFRHLDTRAVSLEV